MTPKTILIVENDRSIRLFLSINLQARGHEVLVTGNLATASSDIQRFSPDMIILDLFLDDGHGLDLLKDLVSKKSKIPTIIITGSIADHIEQEQYPNVMRIFQKPFD